MAALTTEPSAAAGAIDATTVRTSRTVGQIVRANGAVLVEVLRRATRDLGARDLRPGGGTVPAGRG